MTLFKKYGFNKSMKRFIELSKMIPPGQLISFGLTETIGFARAILTKYIRQWGYLGKMVFFGKGIYIPFAFNKYIGDHSDLREYCRIEGKGEVRIGSNSGVGDYGIIRCSKYIYI